MTMCRHCGYAGSACDCVDRREQPAAPAEQEISAEEKFCDGHCSWAEHHPDCSLSAPPAQPVAHLWQHGETGRTRIVMPDQIFTADANWLLVGPMYLHPAAAPAEQSRGLLTCAGCGSPDWPLHEDGCPIRHAEVNRVWNSPMTGFRGSRTPDAAPSVAPEPVAWTLQSELDAAQTTCSAHLWFTNPRNSAWTALFTREQIAAHPPRAPLTDEDLKRIMTMQPIYSDDRDHMHTIRMGRAVESAVRKILTAAPAEPKGADGLPVSAPRLYADEEPPGHADHGSKARDLFDAAPSVAPEPVDLSGKFGPLPETGWDEVPARETESPTSGMSIEQRILHVGGRNNAAGYVEFGSVQAVQALVRQVLRDLPRAAVPSYLDPYTCKTCGQLTDAPSEAPKPVAWQERQEVERGVFGDWYTTNSGWSTLRPPEVLSGGIRYQFRPLYAHPPRAPLTDEHPYTYTSTQATNCAGCGEYKHTPLRIDAMGGYVCLTCIDKKLGTVLGEFGYPAPQAPLTEEQKRDLVKECDLDWQRGFMPLFDGDPTNRYAVLIEAVEAAHGIGGK